MPFEPPPPPISDTLAAGGWRRGLADTRSVAGSNPFPTYRCRNALFKSEPRSLCILILIIITENIPESIHALWAQIQNPGAPVQPFSYREFRLAGAGCESFGWLKMQESMQKSIGGLSTIMGFESFLLEMSFRYCFLLLLIDLDLIFSLPASSLFLSHRACISKL